VQVLIVYQIPALDRNDLELACLTQNTWSKMEMFNGSELLSYLN
jgi:hypothetical protein